MGPDELDDATFAMGEEVAGLLSWLGADSLVVGDQTLVHAARVEDPKEPLTGHGDEVVVGDLVEVWHHDPHRGEILEMVGIVNRYDARTRDLAVVKQESAGYNVSFMSLSGPWGRRTMKLLQEAPEGSGSVKGADLGTDLGVMLLDARFAEAGHPREPHLLDVPIVETTNTKTVHAAPLGRERAVCGTVLPVRGEGFRVFDAARDGTCKRCVQKTLAAARDARVGTTEYTSRALRAMVYATTYREEYYS